MMTTEDNSPRSRESARVEYVTYRTQLERRLNEIFDDWRDTRANHPGVADFENSYGCSGLQMSITGGYLQNQIQNHVLWLAYQAMNSADAVEDLRSHTGRLLDAIRERYAYESSRADLPDEWWQPAWLNEPGLQAGLLRLPEDFLWVLQVDVERADDIWTNIVGGFDLSPFVPAWPQFRPWRVFEQSSAIPRTDPIVSDGGSPQQRRGRPPVRENHHPEVEVFLENVALAAGAPISFKQFCLVAGFPDDTVFKGWRRDDKKKYGKVHAHRFERVLAMTPSDFIAKLSSAERAQVPA
jgi:hypothetical protein